MSKSLEEMIAEANSSAGRMKRFRKFKGNLSTSKAIEICKALGSPKFMLHAGVSPNSARFNVVEVRTVGDYTVHGVSDKSWNEALNNAGLFWRF